MPYCGDGGGLCLWVRGNLGGSDGSPRARRGLEYHPGPPRTFPLARIKSFGTSQILEVLVIRDDGEWKLCSLQPVAPLLQSQLSFAPLGWASGRRKRKDGVEEALRSVGTAGPLPRWWMRPLPPQMGLEGRGDGGWGPCWRLLWVVQRMLGLLGSRTETWAYRGEWRWRGAMRRLKLLMKGL